MKRAIYKPGHGRILAVSAGADGMEFSATDTSRPFETVGQIAIVDIRGPLLQHREPSLIWDSYECITNRISEAFASSCSAVVLRMNSPGGDALGVFEAAREIRDLARDVRKPLFAYADGTIASAAYALACAAEAIYVPVAGFVGSVGVIKMLLDTTAADRAMGLNFAVIASGARKADGNPHLAISDGAREATQAQVDSLAELFFSIVSEMRGVPAADVRGLEAAMFHGQKAVSAKLADGVATFNELLAMVAAGPKPKAMQAETVNTMDKKELRAWLSKMAEGEGEAAEKAKAALKCLDESDDAPPEKKKDEPAATDAPPPEKKDAAAAAPPPAEEKKDPDAKALVAIVHTLQASIAERDAKDAKAADLAHRTSLLASRPDFSATVKASLMKGDLATLEDAVKNWERGPALAMATAAAAQVNGTRGQEQGNARGSQLSPAEKAELDARMGLGSQKKAIRREGRGMVFGAMSAEDARAHLAEKAAADKAAGVKGGER